MLFRIFSLLVDALRESEAGMETEGADFCIFIFLKFGADCQHSYLHLLLVKSVMSNGS